MPVITLTSDWGIKDHYLATVKGVLLQHLPDANIIDISHEIPPFNLKEAAYVLRNAYPFFPDGSIHILGIDTEESDEHPHVVLKKGGHFFIGADNGVFSLIFFNEPPDECVELNIMQDSDFFTFSTRDRFIKAAVHLAKGLPLKDLGPVHENLLQKSHFKPVVENDAIKGIVIYIDNYENVITNITREMFNTERKGRNYKVVIRGEEIPGISESYSDVAVSHMAALFGSNGHLEIAINQGNASSLLGLYMDAPVRIEFY